MKRFSRSVFIAIASFGLLSASGLSQVSGTGTSSSTSAAKPLSSGDRKIVKDAAEQILAVNHLVEITKHQGPGSEDLKKRNVKINSDFDKIWGELGTLAQARKADLPKTEATANDKALLSKLRKTGKDEPDKFDKAFLKALDKETKKAAQVFEAAEKSAQEPELKTVISTWTPKIKLYADEVAAAEAEAAKKK